MDSGAERWHRALRALDLLACDPVGLGGLHLMARAGPVRDRFLAEARARLGELRKIYPAIADDQMFGAIDLEGSLAAGRVTRTAGVLAQGGPFLLCMAERTPPALAARLAQALDARKAAPIIAQDETDSGASPLPRSLADRLAFIVDLDGLRLGDCAAGGANAAAGPAPKGSAELSPEQRDQIVRIADALGIAGLRVPLHCTAAARAAATTAGRFASIQQDIETATLLVLAPRATQLPEAQQTEDPPPDDLPDGSDSARDRGDAPTAPRHGDDENLTDREGTDDDDLLIAAARATLPADLLERQATAHQRGAQGSGSGAARRSRQRGRPLPSRPGALDGQSRIDLLATLRAAAPWQRMRRAQHPIGFGVPPSPTILVRRSDIRIRRYRERAERVLVFVVDASGSAAMARLGEAKGAVELLLARAYARRDHVALISFRGSGAELLLPPTRALARARRELASLPGGGGTPMAAGLRAAHLLVQSSAARGMTPLVAILSDGQANVALDGTPGRERASADAETMGRSFALCGTGSILIDAGLRPNDGLRRLAETMHGTYVPLPRASSSAIHTAIAAAMPG